ncbi:hypothetical protein FB451DRAFT_197256 [Mycena latifolia]|nr:hypothetical protein FB451DRAFT_197256 [Mycena latifolia]
MATTQISERFCSSDADMAVLSSDRVLFKVHRKNLEVHSDIFADATSTTKPENGDDIVHLSESSDVLDLLFQYMYRQPQPDLDTVEFPIFAGLAEAAEKYVVYSALTLCRMKMKDSIISHPLEVLDYAVKHGHVKLANEAAPQSMGHTAAESLELLAPDTFKIWIIFYDQWHRKSNIFLSALLARYPETDVNLLTRVLADPKGCYTFREELRQIFFGALTGNLWRGNWRK